MLCSFGSGHCLNQAFNVDVKQALMRNKHGISLHPEPDCACHGQAGPGLRKDEPKLLTPTTPQNSSECPRFSSCAMSIVWSLIFIASKTLLYGPKVHMLHHRPPCLLSKCVPKLFINCSKIEPKL